MKVPATIVKQEYVSIKPKEALKALHKLWLESLNLPTSSPVLKDGFWCRDESIQYGHYDMEKYSPIRKVTEEELKVYDSFKTLFNTKLETER